MRRCWSSILRLEIRKVIWEKRIRMFCSTSSHLTLTQLPRNTIPLMSYRKERCLLLCLHTTILGLALGDGAFANDLTASSIYHLKVPFGQNELNLLWKDSFLEKPIFGTMTADSFRRRLQRAGEIIGLDIKVNPYTGRRGAAEAFDNSCKGWILLYVLSRA